MASLKEERANRIERLRTDFTETEKVILNRRSVRLYTKEAVPEFMVKRILEAGRFAPTGGNCQAWKFVVLRDPELIEAISETVVKICKIFKAIVDYRRPGFFWLRPIANLFIRRNRNDLHPVPFGAITMLAERKFTVWHGALTVILIFMDVRGVGSPRLDCGIAGQNMVIAAHSMGLGTCWVSFCKPAFQYTSKWNKRLGIGYPYKIVSSLAIGWPRGEPEGMVERQTHAVDWFEGGEKRLIY